MTDDQLEGKLLFRLIRVVYAVAFLFSLVIVAIIGWEEKPEKYVSDEKSYITCKDIPTNESRGKTYLLKNIDAYVYYGENTLKDYNDTKAKVACSFGTKWTVFDKAPNLPLFANYDLRIVKETQGSWSKVFLWWAGGGLASYAILNIARETLNYVLFGLRFQWDWLRKLASLLNS